MSNDRAWMYQRLDDKGFLNSILGCWDAETVKVHLMSKGFIRDYYEWNRHGEPYIARQSGEQSSTYYSNIEDRRDENNLMYNMVMDAAGPSFDPEMPNSEAQKIYDILKSSERVV
ncbi:hypothetical protein POM88_004615 [Heracleum sosnowskyi]|uniref:Uncharacterized protein n=1 Tax=Heracleum sosnowskyi TaxID=360622 RepID=A0AAD8JNA6_9APIA|nr:hypothetical protein POM88_004615 [Heracleum sosnowskyi]